MLPAAARVWIPVTESRVRVELLGGRIILSGKTDLTLGRPAGRVANKVIIDLKSGRPNLTHREDLRFYALLEAVSWAYHRAAGLVPTSRRLVRTRRTTVALLRSAVRRTIDGVAKIAEPRDRARAIEAARADLPLVPTGRRLHRGAGRMARQADGVEDEW